MSKDKSNSLVSTSVSLTNTKTQSSFPPLPILTGSSPAPTGIPVETVEIVEIVETVETSETTTRTTEVIEVEEMDDEDELADDDDDKVDIERNEQVEFPCTFFLFF